MKKNLIFLAAAFAAMIAIAPRTVDAAAEFSAGIQINATADFTAPLTPYGTWIDFKSYGRCWRPAHVEADWRPYCVGSWEWTDAGWYWDSDEPFSWACYHYGSWDFDPSYGWVWIPGTDWAPAWVTWRSSDDYIGWAPCGPGLAVLAPSLFTFCDVHHFRDHFSPHDLIINNATIINRTRVIKDFQRQSVNVDGRQRTIFANKGPGVDPIQRATGAKFTPRPIGDVMHETHTPETPRRETLPSTGKEEPRVFQQPEQKAPEPKAPEIENKAPELPKERPAVIPPTGREQPRIYHEVPTPQPKKEIPVPAEPRVVTPPEKVLPPTGRENAPSSEREAPARVQPPTRAPSAPAAPADGHERDGHKDGNG